MPIELRRNVFRAVVGVFELAGFVEFCEGFLRSASAAEIVAVHVMRMGNFGREAHIDFSVFERFLGAADGLGGVGKIVMRGGMVGGQRESSLVVGDGFGSAVLAVGGGGAFAGKPKKDPKPRIVGVRSEGVIQRLAVSEIKLCVVWIGEIGELGGANLNALAF